MNKTDQHYVDTRLDGSRKNYSLQDKLYDLYTTDKEYFQIAKQFDDALFTHAGVSTAWLKRHDLILPKTDADIFLNEIYNTTPDIFWEMSWDRGGWYSTGSPIWHDVRESDCDDTLFQVFGHTQLRENPIKLGNFACIDCRRAFVVDTVSHEIEKIS